MTYHFDIGGRGRPKVRPKAAVTLSQLTKTILSRKTKAKETELHLATKEFVPQLNLPAEEAYMSGGRQLRKRPGLKATTTSHKRSRRSVNLEDWSLGHEVIKIEDDDDQLFDANEENNKDELFEQQIDNLFQQIVPPSKKKKTVGKQSRAKVRTSKRQTRSSTLGMHEEVEESETLSDIVDQSEGSPDIANQSDTVGKKSRAKTRTGTSKRQTRSSTLRIPEEIQDIEESEESENLSDIVNQSEGSPDIANQSDESPDITNQADGLPDIANQSYGLPDIPISNNSSVPPISTAKNGKLDDEPSLNSPSSENEVPENIFDEATAARDDRDDRDDNESLPDIGPGFSADDNNYDDDNDADQDQPAYGSEDDNNNPVYDMKSNVEPSEAADEPIVEAEPEVQSSEAADEPIVEAEPEVEPRADEELEDQPAYGSEDDGNNDPRYDTKSNDEPIVEAEPEVEPRDDEELEDQPAYESEDDNNNDPTYDTESDDEPSEAEDEPMVEAESEVEPRADEELEDESMNDLIKPKKSTKASKTIKPKKVKLPKTPKVVVPKPKAPKAPKIHKPPKPPREKKEQQPLRPVNPMRPVILRTNRLDFMFHAIEQYLPDEDPIQTKPEVLSRLYKPPTFKIFEEYDHHDVYTPPSSPIPVSLKAIAESGNHSDDQEKNEETKEKDDDVTMISKEDVHNDNERAMLSPEAAKRQAINLDRFFFDFTVQLYKKCCSDEMDPCWFLHELEYNYIKSHLTEFEYLEIPPLSFKRRQGINFGDTDGTGATRIQDMPKRVAVYGLRQLTIFKSSSEYTSQFKTLINRVVPASLVEKRVEFLNSVITDGVDLFFCRDLGIINEAMVSTKGKKLWSSGGYWRRKVSLVEDVEKALFNPECRANFVDESGDQMFDSIVPESVDQLFENILSANAEKDGEGNGQPNEKSVSETQKNPGEKSGGVAQKDPSEKSSGEAEKTPTDKSDMEVDKEMNEEAAEKSLEEPKDNTVNKGENELEKSSDDAEKESGAKSGDEEVKKANDNSAMEVDKDPNEESNKKNDDEPMDETVNKEQNGTEGGKVLNNQSGKEPMKESSDKVDEPNSKFEEVDNVSHDLSAKKAGDEPVDQSVDKDVDSRMEVDKDVDTEPSDKVVDNPVDDVVHKDAEPNANSEMEIDNVLNNESGEKVDDTPMDEAIQNGDKDSTGKVSDEVVNVGSKGEGSKELLQGIVEKPNVGECKSADQGKQQPSDKSGAKEDKVPSDKAGIEESITSKKPDEEGLTASNPNEIIAEPAVVEPLKESSSISEIQTHTKTVDEETPTTEKLVEDTAQPKQASSLVVNQDTSSKSLETPEQEDVEMADAPDSGSSENNGARLVQVDSLAVIAKAAISQSSGALDEKGSDSITGNVLLASVTPPSKFEPSNPTSEEQQLTVEASSNENVVQEAGKEGEEQTQDQQFSKENEGQETYQTKGQQDSLDQQRSENQEQQQQQQQTSNNTGQVKPEPRYILDPADLTFGARQVSKYGIHLQAKSFVKIQSTQQLLKTLTSMIFPGYQLRNRRTKMSSSVFGVMGTMYVSMRPYLSSMLLNLVNEFYRIPYLKVDSILFELELTEFKKHAGSGTKTTIPSKNSIPIPLLKVNGSPKKITEC
ncbi:unnamed protein product [Ambrosiozyma monospora]|uniref:Unnamed protein product n=1 Tax=Ambrosiozyma monospora TaxID=43982 RepID=A0A9W6YX13_AMBMO|nr:unnamed protein product [Ambrosiozyma monospora]